MTLLVYDLWLQLRAIHDSSNFPHCTYSQTYQTCKGVILGVMFPALRSKVHPVHPQVNIPLLMFLPKRSAAHAETFSLCRRHLHRLVW